MPDRQETLEAVAEAIARVYGWKPGMRGPKASGVLRQARQAAEAALAASRPPVSGGPEGEVELALAKALRRHEGEERWPLAGFKVKAAALLADDGLVAALSRVPAEDFLPDGAARKEGGAPAVRGDLHGTRDERLEPAAHATPSYRCVTHGPIPESEVWHMVPPFHKGCGGFVEVSRVPADGELRRCDGCGGTGYYAAEVGPSRATGPCPLCGGTGRGPLPADGEQPAEPEFICSRCGAEKGEHALGEGCSGNDGGKVIRNPRFLHERALRPADGPLSGGLTAEDGKILLALVNAWARSEVARIGDGLLREHAEVVEAAESTAERVQHLRVELHRIAEGPTDDAE